MRDETACRYDLVTTEIAHYVCRETIRDPAALDAALLCLGDSLACALLALQEPACVRLIQPLIPESIIPNGSRVPGTSLVVDPVDGAFAIGALIRWQDFNDTFLAAEWGHPSDNLGALLAIGDRYSRKVKEGRRALLVEDLIQALIKAYEIQGVLSLENSLHDLGFDHVLFVKAASAAVSCWLMGGDEERVAAAISQVWCDLGPLRCYRHAPCTGSRKSWAAADATSRGLFLALLTMRSEQGYPEALTAPCWGFYDNFSHGHHFKMGRSLGSYVVENILFKPQYPAEYHAQTAVEAAILLHSQLICRWDEIEEIEIKTHKAAKMIIDKEGPLTSPADRDHCLQYIVAVALLKGSLEVDDYEDEAASEPLIDFLRSKMSVVEEERFSLDYLEESKRSVANSIAVKLKNGQILGPQLVEYPLGHRKRREECKDALMAKLKKAVHSRLSSERSETIIHLLNDYDNLRRFPICAFLDLFYVAS